jgi:hypothetical protein
MKESMTTDPAQTAPGEAVSAPTSSGYQSRTLFSCFGVLLLLAMRLI